MVGDKIFLFKMFLLLLVTDIILFKLLSIGLLRVKSELSLLIVS